ncbi:hypothetical protein GIB67_031407, partial [Kingdonia uniflora]
MPLFIMVSSIGSIWFSKRQAKPPSLGYIVCLQTYFHHHAESSLLRSVSYAFLVKNTPWISNFQIIVSWELGLHWMFCMMIPSASSKSTMSLGKCQPCRLIKLLSIALQLFHKCRGRSICS